MPIESGYKSWTKSKIVELLENNDKAVERALIVIFNNQELDEQSSDSTHKANGIGSVSYTHLTLPTILLV